MKTLYQAQPNQHQVTPQTTRVRVTARITTEAYDALSELQRRHRRQTGRALRLWQILDAAIRAYAQSNGVDLRF